MPCTNFTLSSLSPCRGCAGSLEKCTYLCGRGGVFIYRLHLASRTQAALANLWGELSVYRVCVVISLGSDCLTDNDVKLFLVIIQLGYFADIGWFCCCLFWSFYKMLVKKIFWQKKFSSNYFWSQKNLVEFFWGLGWNIFCKNNLVGNFFGSKKIWVGNCFGSKRLGPKKILGPKQTWSEIFLGQKNWVGNFLGQKIFGSKKIWVRFFWWYDFFWLKK